MTCSTKLLPSPAREGPLIAMLRSASLDAAVMLTGSPDVLEETGLLLAWPL